MVLTKKLLHELTRAQCTYAAKLLADDHWEYSDDAWDYAQAAAELAHIMLQLDYNDDLDGLNDLLKKGLSDFACDGIGPAFYELKPKALED